MCPLTQWCLTLQPRGLQLTTLLCPGDSPGENIGVGYQFLLQGIFLTQGSNPGLPHCWQILYQLSHREAIEDSLVSKVKSLSRVQLFATPQTVAYQSPLSMGFSKQEYWSGLPFPSPGDLPDPGIKPGSPALQTDALASEPPGNLKNNLDHSVPWSVNKLNIQTVAHPVLGSE